MLHELPELLSSAISSACKSGRPLSGKIQEGKKGTLIQLIWSQPDGAAIDDKAVKVGSKQKSAGPSIASGTTAGVRRKRRYPPSKARRNAKRLQEFLEKKRQKVLDFAAQSPRSPVTQPVVQEEHETQPPQLAHKVLVSPVSQVDIVDTELRDLIFGDKVDCVGEFGVRDEVPGMDLEMVSGDSLWTPLRVLRPQQQSPVVSGKDECEVDLTVSELQDLDSIVFEGREVDSAPGLILRKGCLQVWTPIARRTRSRLKS
jgi:hypothetical protein